MAVGAYNSTELFPTGSPEHIQQTGFGHGRDEIIYYPPSCWGRNIRPWRSIKLAPMSISDRLYLEAYKAGHYHRFPKPQ